MIPTKREDVQITSTIEGESIRMRIDEDATEHIIALLTDLYSDPEAAIVREVSTNALDSHVAAGQTRPIEVTTPTSLSPVFKVQDWGLGLNADDFRNIYSLYGKSTKTDTNDQTGSLGLGCKSPLTYTNQFTVVGVKDGIKTSAMVSRDEDGIPTMEIVDESPTDEPNGATIVIPTKTYTRLEVQAQQFFRFWPQGSVLINGTEPTRELNNAVRVNDEAILFEEDGYPTSYVLMCNVAYPIKREHLEELDLGYRQAILFEVPAGSVHFTPSREELNYTRRTRETIAGLVERFSEAFVAAAQADIDQTPTHHEALRKATQWHDRLPRQYRTNLNFTYKGEEIPGVIECPGPETAVFTVTYGEKGYGKMSASSRKQKIDYGMVPKALWVYGFDRPSFTAATKKRLWAFCDQQDIPHPEQFILSSSRVRSKWIDKTRHIPWSAVEQIKLPRGGKSGGATTEGRLAGSYDLVRSTLFTQYEVPADQIDTGSPIFWTDSEEGAGRMAAKLAKLEAFDDFTVVVLFPNRVAKFQRMFPEAKPAHDAFTEIFNTWWDFLSRRQQEALVINGTSSTFKRLKATEVHDPDVRRAIVAAHSDVSTEAGILGLFGYSTTTLIRLLDWTNPLDKYTLFDDRSYYYSDQDLGQIRQHNTIYINAVYKELYENV